MSCVVAASGTPWRVALFGCGISDVRRVSDATPMTGGDITQILEAAERGDRQAAEQLLPLVYGELRRLASQKLSHEAPGHTLEATALVHEAYLRLVGPVAGAGAAPKWEGRRHFFAAAAEAMRRILVDSARRRQSLKRGGGAVRHDVE